MNHTQRTLLAISIALIFAHGAQANDAPKPAADAHGGETRLTATLVELASAGRKSLTVVSALLSLADLDRVKVTCVVWPAKRLLLSAVMATTGGTVSMVKGVMAVDVGVPPPAGVTFRIGL